MLHLLLALQIVTPPAVTDAIAVVNIQRLLTESNVGKAAAAKVHALRAEREKLLAERQATIDASIKEGTPAIQIQRMRIDFARLAEDADKDVADLAKSVQADFEKRLRPILQKIVDEDHLGIVLEVPNPLVVWLHPSVDLTSKVLARLDAPEPKQ
jgi:Skp family chaperone for outer membrane proteins